MLRVSVLELPARWGGAEDALAEVDRLIAERPTDVAVLPEMALTGYVSPEGDFDLTRFAEPIDGPTMRVVAEIARRRSVRLVAPLVLAEAGRLYNAAVVVGADGRTLASYRKRHPWLPERWATPGPAPHTLFQLGPLSATLAICFDGQFLVEEAAEVLAEADLLIFTSAWVDDEDSRVPLLRSIARQFGVSIANANWAPGVVSVPGQGGSCILDAHGELLATIERQAERRADALISPRSRSNVR